MTITMYSASVPIFLRFLNNLSGLLDKASAYAAEEKIDESVLVMARLYPNMLPLSSQVQIACDAAKKCASRLAEIEAPVDEDNEATIAELKDRIARTLAFLKTVSADQIDGTEDKPVRLELPMGAMDLTGLTYLQGFALPNFFFHVTTAHAILRHNGVPIGKRDFMGG